jgi:hypothetical protein
MTEITNNRQVGRAKQKYFNDMPQAPVTDLSAFKNAKLGDASRRLCRSFLRHHSSAPLVQHDHLIRKRNRW